MSKVWIGAPVLVLTACGLCAAQAHDGDVILTADTDARLVTNTHGIDDEIVESRVFEAEFGADGIADFTDEPGFDSPIGALPANALLGFDILAAARVWREGTFETIADERIRIRKSGIDRWTPDTDETVPGFVFGDVNASGVFHHHLGFTLVDGPGAGTDGIWLLQLGLWSDSGVLAPSRPFWVVFAQGSGTSEQDDAVAWVLEHLVGTPCAADFNADGVADFFDLQAFLGRFAQGEPSADLNADGLLDFFDLQAFLNAFAAGC